MNTKEAIEWISETQDENLDLQEEYDNKKILEIIRLLKRGEKYEAMWGELYKYFLSVSHRDMCKLYDNHITLEMDILKQKYFPPEICGFCTEYDSDNCYCLHMGEMMEEDTCDGFQSEEELEAQKVDAAERENHRKEVEGDIE